MALEVRYTGEFLSRKGTTWRVEILQESAFPFEEVGELTFDADDALEIEWNEADKTVSVLGSTATLKIQSPTDRAYIDLYTIAVGQIRMDVYREGVLYWRGMMDTEFYEEPYEMLDHYTVTLMFSDFGILDRLVFNRAGTGMSDLHDLVMECLDRAGLEYDSVKEIISTSLSEGGNVMTLADLSVRNANFYDEEGEAMTMQEVLEGILQPLCLRITQKAGVIYIYDLNALYYQGEQKETVWSSDSQTLGVDSVYNNVKITFSPYAQNIEFDDTVWDQDIDDETLCPYDSVSPTQFSTRSVYGYDYLDGAVTIGGDDEDVNNKGFSLWTATGTALTSLCPAFKEIPFYKGEDCEGFALRWITTQIVVSSNDTYYYYDNGLSNIQLSAAWSYQQQGSIPHTALFRSFDVEVPLLNNPSDFTLCIAMELLIAATTTPYHDTEPKISYGYFSGTDWGKTYDKMSEAIKGTLNYILIPVDILFIADDGNTYVWQNMSVDYPNISLAFSYSWKESLGSWVLQGSNTHQSYLAYYNATDPVNNGASCFGAWGTNSHFAGLSFSTLAEATKVDGQCIAYPDLGVSGTISVRVYTGWLFYSCVQENRVQYNKFYAKGFHDFEDDDSSQEHFTLDYIKWVLCKAPTVKICNATAYDLDLNTDDIEYSAVINADAKEDLEIDTVCGTGVVRPTARGAYYKTNDAQMMGETFSRNGLTGAVEELMIATAYSQYAERHTSLEGEAEIDTDGLHVYTEQNQGDTLFLAVEQVENVIQDIANTTIVELSEDDYEPES